MSGVTRQSYAPEIRIIRLMCTGRVDLSFILRAFVKRADGVIIGGCWPGECHYVTEGNYDALGNVLLARKLLAHIGVRPERLRLEWIAASEGTRFAEVMSDFARQLAELGPLGPGDGLADDNLALRLGAVARLVPYLKLVEREKLRVPVKSEAAYSELYDSPEVARLFTEAIADRLTDVQITMLLEDRPRSTAEIADALGLDSSAVSRHVKSSSRQGLIQYLPEQGRYALPRVS
jgi:F420-non-reducing hydrogenase iron-sulfur subunit